jgi:hypothetical protein
MAMRERTPVIRKNVSLAYNGDEVVNLVRAAHQLPPYRLDLGPSRLRIDCHSLANGNWRCAFIFARNNKKGWSLELIEYDFSLTMKRALASLGALEEMGLKHLKHGL